MSLSVRLVGYHKETERLMSERDIPAGLLTQALLIVEIRQRPTTDPIVDYPLTEAKAVRLNKLLGAKIDRNLDYFLEVTSAEPLYA